MVAIMADEKQEKTEETAGTNAGNTVQPSGALPLEGSAPVSSPHVPPVSHIMPHDPSLPPRAEPLPERVPFEKNPATKSVAAAPQTKAKPIVEEMNIERKPKLKNLADEFVKYPSPDHVPVSHLMPHEVIIPTDPMHVPPKPPTANVMPPAPALTIELNVPPSPDFSKPNTPTTPKQAAPDTQHESPVQKPVTAPEAVPHSDDPIADAVGLVRPKPRARIPDHPGQNMTKILEDIKLPEKRSYAPTGERKITPTTTEQSATNLDDILSAKITEATVTPVPEASGPAQNVVPDQNVFHEEMEISSVHTLKHDLQHVVQEQKMSVVKAVALEQEKKARMERTIEPPRPPSRAPSIILTALIFLMLGLGALGGVYYVAVLQSAPGPSPVDSALVFAEQTVAFPLADDSSSLKTQLARARSSGGTLGSLLHIIPVTVQNDANGNTVQKPATISGFFEALGIEPPENLMRALGDEFFLGIHTVDKNAPIMVIQVVSYDRAFDGMLTWEKNMNGDLAPLFQPVARLVMGADGLQTERTFSDLVMRNYDVRALKDDEGVIQMYYSFPTRDLLIIAESPYTFTEILSRLQAGRRL